MHFSKAQFPKAMFPKANKNAYTQELEYAEFQKQTLIIRQI